MERSRGLSRSRRRQRAPGCGGTLARLGGAAALACAGTLAAQIEPVGTTRWSPDGTIEYVVGNAPLIVSAGHGGDLEPTNIPDRTYGTLVKDSRTLELAREFADELAQRFRLRPHLVLCHLSRRKVDVNRDIVEGAQGNPAAQAAYNAFHQALTDARASVLSSWGFGFYLDLHGHGHPENWIELGYSLTSTQLALPDPTLAQASYVAQSTIRSAGSGAGVYFPDLLRGTSSLGAHLEAGGYASVPGPTNPHPNGGNYFSGGFNVDTYGSLNGTPVDGVQIESPFSVRSTVLVRRPFLARVGGWLEPFFVAHRGSNPALGARITVAATDRIASETGGRAGFVLTRSGSLATARQVPLQWRGTATAGTDYPPPPATATFGIGVAELQIPLVALDDAAAEGDETVALWLAAGNDLGVPNHAEVVVHDDDTLLPLALQLPLDTVGGTTPDTSGHGRHGTLQPSGAGPVAVAGRSGGALRCDGVDDRVRIADFPWASGAEFSLAFWFRSNDTTSAGFRYLVSHGGVAATHRLGVYFDQATGVLRTALIYANDLTGLDVLDVSRDLRDGQWHHYALVATADRLVRVFIDGEPEVHAQFLGTTIDPAGDIVLGARSDLATSTFAAVDLDDVQLWSRALGAVEVALLEAPPDSEAMVYPGGGEAIELATGTTGPVTAGPRHDVKHAPPGTTVVATYRSPGAVFDGGLGVLAGEIVGTGGVLQDPLLPWLHLHAPLIVHGPIVLGPTGGAWTASIPIGLAGSSLVLQPVALHPSVANGLFAIGDAHEIRF